ncbi:MAG: hypothetical protein QXD13_00050 [Candidatus Pacearchaeota archaeon]
MNKWLEILVGIILIVVPIAIALTYASWWAAAISVLKGGILWFLLLIGVLFVMLGISDLKG